MITNIRHIIIILLSIYVCQVELQAQEFHRTNTDNTPTCSATDCYIVTGESNRCYLNSCWAELKGDSVVAYEYQSKNYRIRDVYSWPILLVCFSDKNKVDMPEATPLDDGTFLYTEKNGNTFRGTQSICDFLSGETLISTRRGEIPISLLTAADSIYAGDHKGDNKGCSLVRVLNKVPVSHYCEMICVKLADGRQLNCGGGHGNTDYNNFTGDQPSTYFEGIKIGDKFQGSKVISVERINYEGEYVYDVLPLGTNLYYWCAEYWANGIRVKSPMANWFYTEDLLRLGW
jgi:hypothetical protein